jgi:hypothetical protein
MVLAAGAIRCVQSTRVAPVASSFRDEQTWLRERGAARAAAGAHGFVDAGSLLDVTAPRDRRPLSARHPDRDYLAWDAIGRPAPRPRGEAGAGSYLRKDGFIMNKLLKYALSTATFVGIAIGAPGSASATTVYNPGHDGQYCVSATASVNGVMADNSLNVTGWASASLWNGGGCDGSAAEAGYVQMSATLFYSPAVGAAGVPVAYLTEPNNPQFNTYNFWGTYLATFANGPPMTGGDVPRSSLKGNGFYSIGIEALVWTGSSWQGGITYSSWTYASFH